MKFLAILAMLPLLIFFLGVIIRFWDEMAGIVIGFTMGALFIWGILELMR